jgi:GLPGLI family protein
MLDKNLTPLDEVKHSISYCKIKESIFMISSFLLTTIFYSTAFSQSKKITEFKPTFIATYQYKFTTDTMQRSKYRITTLLLFFNNDESYCISNERFYNDSLIIDGYEKIQGNASQLAMNMARMPMAMKSTSHNYLIRKERAKKMITYFTNISVDEMYYQEPMDAVKWQLVDSAVTFQGFECKMAKKRYNGRNYTALYTLSIPAPDGPLKFSGLPGQIIQLKDDRDEVDISLTELKPFTEIVRFFQSANPIKTERKKLYDLLIQDYLDPFKTDEILLNVRVSENQKADLIRKRQEALKLVNNRLEKE